MTAWTGANTKPRLEMLTFSEMEHPMEPQGDISSDTHSEGPPGEGGAGGLPGSSLPPATPAQQVSQTRNTSLGVVLPHLFQGPADRILHDSV